MTNPNPLPVDGVSQEPYVPKLIYFADRDEFEFVTKDTATIYRDLLPSDGVAIIFDMTSRDPIGFRVAGSMVRAAIPPAAGGVSEARVEAAALVSLARSNIPTDVQDLLVSGDPMRSIPPHALRSALTASDALAPAAGGVSEARVEAALKAFRSVYRLEIISAGHRRDNAEEAIVAALGAAGVACPSTGLPMASAPKDGTMLRLLVEYDHQPGSNPLEDADRSWTIGFNNLSDTEEDVWQFAGWDWEQDCFTDGTGTPIGWLPFHAVSDALAPAAGQPVAIKGDEDEEAAREEGYAEGFEDGRSETKGVEAQLWRAMQTWLIKRDLLDPDQVHEGYSLHELLDALATLEADYRKLARSALAPIPERVNAVVEADYFAGLVSMARRAAYKASVKFPQPTYVTLKIAEEAGEVVRGAVHYAEGRMEWSEVEGEIIQLLAMLIRFVTEGDQVNGVVPPALASLTPAKE